jgi:hypothetical protein
LDLNGGNLSQIRRSGTVHFYLKAWQVIMWSASSVMMHALTEVNALLKMFYTTKEIIGNCPKMNRPGVRFIEYSETVRWACSILHIH